MHFKRIIITGIFIAICAPRLSAQTINLYGGTPLSGGFSGDGGAATSALLNVPKAMCIDRIGNVYITDQSNYRIRKIDTSGIITTVAGVGTMGYSGDGGAATSAELNQPVSVATDTFGNLYIADQGNQTIRKIDTGGVITTIAGNGTEGFSGDGSAASSAVLRYPIGLALDAIGNIYFVDRGNARIRKIDTGGIITTVVGDGTNGYTGDGGAATSAEINMATDLAFDAIGNMYIADEVNSVIRKVDTSNVITTIAGDGTTGFSGDSSAATSAQLGYPSGVSVDAYGIVFIADGGNNRIRIVDTAGNIYTYAGDGTHSYGGDGGPALSAQLSVWDLVIDPNENLFLTDELNNAVREITPPPTSLLNYFLANGNNLKLYPNPNNGILTLTGTIEAKDGTVHLEVLDMTGKVVLTESARVKNGSINKQIRLSNSTPAGHYILRVKTDQRTSTLKFDKK